jgi:hypothetical protein
MKVIIDKVV